uniref:Uncharacterized protein n=1 Tax=Anopheles atroparvus TaxID=41427 RepID=A0A182J8J0_ANOAO
MADRAEADVPLSELPLLLPADDEDDDAAGSIAAAAAAAAAAVASLLSLSTSVAGLAGLDGRSAPSSCSHPASSSPASAPGAGPSIAVPLAENRIGIDCLRRFFDRSGSESELSCEAFVGVLLWVLVVVVATFRNDDESVRLEAFSVEPCELLVCEELDASLSAASSPLRSGGGVA